MTFMNKTGKYQLLYEQVKALLDKEKDEIANMANIAALIHETFKFWWTGIRNCKIVCPHLHFLLSLIKFTLL